MAFDQSIADKVLDGLSQGKSLRAVCKADGMPHASTILNWCEDCPEFGQQYARVRARSYQLLAEEILEISDESSADSYVDDNGNERTNSEVVARSKLRVDSRKWMLSKMLPKVYGDKLELAGDKDNPLLVVVRRLTDEAKP